jgi:hypothetical protein
MAVSRFSPFSFASPPFGGFALNRVLLLDEHFKNTHYFPYVTTSFNATQYEINTFYDKIVQVFALWAGECREPLSKGGEEPARNRAVTA